VPGAGWPGAALEREMAGEGSERECREDGFPWWGSCAA